MFWVSMVRGEQRSMGMLWSVQLYISQFVARLLSRQSITLQARSRSASSVKGLGGIAANASEALAIRRGVEGYGTRVELWRRQNSAVKLLRVDHLRRCRFPSTVRRLALRSPGLSFSEQNPPSPRSQGLSASGRLLSRLFNLAPAQVQFEIGASLTVP